MKEIRIDGVHIAGLAAAMSTRKTRTEDYTDHFGEKIIRKFLKTTGVKERYIGRGNQVSSDLCAIAAEELLKKCRTQADEIDGLIFLTQNPDYLTPSTAFVLQKRLGLSKNCICFDVNMGCTAFLHGIYLAGSMLKAGTARKVMLLMGDARRDHFVTDDTAETLMFGEAGAALLLETGQDVLDMDLFSDGSRFDLIMNPCGERYKTPQGKPNADVYMDYMNGGEVFNFSVSEVPAAIREFLSRRGETLDDYAYLVPHQANTFILKHIANELELPMERLAISMDRYGNTNGASIPVTIVDLAERGELPERAKLLVTGFGIGLSWGVMSLEIDREGILPVIHSDAYYEEGRRLPFLKAE